MLRAIHPVSYHEKFVASGVYTLEGLLLEQNSLEKWSIHQLPDSSELIRVDQGDWRSESSLLVEVLRSANGHIQRCDIHWFQKPSTLKLSYIFFEDYVQISSDNGDRNSYMQEVELPTGTQILALGYVNLRELISIEESEITYFCAGISLSEVNRWLNVRTSRGEDKFITVGGKNHTAKTYLIEAKNGSKASASTLSRATFDQNNILFEWKGQIENALLTQYARRPEPQTS